MDKEKLIRVVRSKKPLWDRSNKFFRNRDHTKELWKEVAEEMDESCDVVKKKWTGLRDVFRREWKHIYAARASSSDNTVVNLHKKSTWPYLENMLFLAPQMVFHEPLENQDVKEELDDSSMHSYPDELPFETQFEEGSYEPIKCEDPAKPVADPQKSPAEIQKMLDDANRDIIRPAFKRPSTFLDSYTSELEEKRTRFLESGDSDQQFLMSLLPFLKAVPGNRKMSVRMRLQQVFLEEEERTNHSLMTLTDLRKGVSATAPAPAPSSSTWVSSNSVSSPSVDLN